MADDPKQQQKDPAFARFMLIQLSRLVGIVMVLAGLAMANGVIGPDPVVGYGLILAGMVETFVIPVIMAKQFRSPKE